MSLIEYGKTELDGTVSNKEPKFDGIRTRYTPEDFHQSISMIHISSQ